jgi:hypothetical protein
MAVTTLTDEQVETAIDTSAPASISKVEAPAKKTMADFGLSSETIALAMNDYAKEFNAGGTPNLADIVLARGGNITDLVELAVNNKKTSKAMMEGTQLDKDKALAETMQAQFFMEDDRGAGKASKLMNIVSKGISKKLESPAPAVDATLETPGTLITTPTLTPTVIITEEPEAKKTSPTPPPLPEVEPAAAVDEKAANEAFLKEQFPGSLGKYVAGKRDVPFGKPQSQMGQMVNKEGYGWHKPLEQRVAGYQAQKGKAEESYAKLAKELLEKQEAVEAKILAAKDRRAASKEASILGFGTYSSYRAVKLAEKEKEIIEKQQVEESKAYDKHIKMLGRKEKIYGTASKAVETAGDAALVVKGMGIKGMAALSGVVNSFREAGLADLNKDKHDAGHLLLGADTLENVSAFKEANAKKTPEVKSEAKPAPVAVDTPAKPEATVSAKSDTPAPDSKAENSITTKVNANPVSPIFQEMAGTKPKEFSISERISHFISGPSPQTLGINVTVADAKALNAVVPPTATPASNAARPKGAEIA